MISLIASAAGPALARLETIGLVGGIAFFLIFAVVAYIAFRMMRRTVKMAFRMAVVTIILAVAVVGGLALYWFGTGSSTTSKPAAPSRSR
ncbi:MAG: hypothetical protein ACK4S4_12660 [Pyrinomonadaceae bacterium]